MTKKKSRKRSSQKKEAPRTVVIHGKRYTLDRETLRQIEIGEKIMADYREVLEKFGKT
jgi:hypothetical protein